MSLRSAPLPMTIEQPEEVEALLCERPELRPYVDEAAHRLVEKFGPDSTIIIDVTFFYDDLIDRLLTVFVTTVLDDGQALDRLDEFDEWWNDQPTEIRTHMLIDVALI